MLTELTLTHPCNEIIVWSAGGYFDCDGRFVTRCPGCREWLGAPFLRAEETHPAFHPYKARLHLAAN